MPKRYEKPPFPPSPFPPPPPPPGYSGSTTPPQPPLPPPIFPQAPPPYQVPPPGWSPWGEKATEPPPEIDQDTLDYDAYTASGGKLSKPDWIKAGKPSSDENVKEGLGVPVRWDVVSIGGWDFHTGYDKFGNIVSQEKLGATREKEGKKGERYTEDRRDQNGDLYEWTIEIDPDGGRTERKGKLIQKAETKPTKPEGLYATYEEALAAADGGYIPEQDPTTGYWYLVPPKKPTPKEKKPKPEGRGDTITDDEGKIWGYNDETGQYDLYMGYDPEKDLKKKAGEAKSAADIAKDAAEAADRQRLYDLQNRQFAYGQQLDTARMAAEKESRLANLRASPASWLQYSLEANQIPVVQPWQKPLMPQQYGNLNVGQPIPGWAGLNQGTANLPELTTPSTQYFARIGPTAQQQWGGYQQMQSGAPLEESFWRMGQQTPPGGRNPGLSWLR